MVNADIDTKVSRVLCNGNLFNDAEKSPMSSARLTTRTNSINAGKKVRVDEKKMEGKQANGLLFYAIFTASFYFGKRLKTRTGIRIKMFIVI